MSNPFKETHLSAKKTFQDLLSPIVGKPALTCALVLMGTYASFDVPTFAPALMLTLAIANHFFPRSRQWVVFLSLAAGIVSYDFANGGSWSFLLMSGNRSTYEHSQQAPPKDGCGRVESVIRRAKGNAYIIKTSVGNETYRLRIAERKMQSKPKVKKTPSEMQEPMVFADTASAGQPLDLYSVTSEPIVAPPWATKASTAMAANPGDTLCYSASWYPVSPPRVPGAFDTRGWPKSQGCVLHSGSWNWQSPLAVSLIKYQRTVSDVSEIVKRSCWLTLRSLDETTLYTESGAFTPILLKLSHNIEAGKRAVSCETDGLQIWNETPPFIGNTFPISDSEVEGPLSSTEAT